MSRSNIPFDLDPITASLKMRLQPEVIAAALPRLTVGDISPEQAAGSQAEGITASNIGHDSLPARCWWDVDIKDDGFPPISASAPSVMLAHTEQDRG